jgi:hypothetical protein
MTIEELKDLITFAKQQGITYLEFGDFKAHLTPNLPSTQSFGIIDTGDETNNSPLPPESEEVRREKARKQLAKDLFNV